jgi:hypothetical protein
LTKAQEIDIGVFALFYVDVLNIRGSNVLVKRISQRDRCHKFKVFFQILTFRNYEFISFSWLYKTNLSPRVFSIITNFIEQLIFI